MKEIFLYLSLIAFIALMFVCTFYAGGYYTPRDCVEVKIHNPLEEYDPITLKKEAK